MSKRAMSALAAAALILFGSCGLLIDRPFAVSAWMPGRERMDAASLHVVSVSFSMDPDRPLAESCFSLAEDGRPISGSCSWEGTTLVFRPYGGFVEDADYVLTVSQEARTEDGLSLASDFEARFTTKAEGERPRITGSVPVDGGVLAGRMDTVTVSCSESVDPLTFRSSVSLSPSVKGYWFLSNGGRDMLFQPFEPFAVGERYSIRVSSGLLSQLGYELGYSWEAGFTAGCDLAPPELASAEAVDQAGLGMLSLVQDEDGDTLWTVNAGWETAWCLRLKFSESVDLASVASHTRLEGGITFKPETEAGLSDSALFLPTVQPVWGQEFTVTILPGIEDAYGNQSDIQYVFRCVADGPGSKPPRLIGVRLPLAPGATDPSDRKLKAYPWAEQFASLVLDTCPESFPIGEAVSVPVELYVEVARGASLDLLSIMESFRITGGNDALDFTPTRVSAGGLDWAAPEWPGALLATVDGTLVNHANSGIITLSVAEGFHDSVGNSNAESQDLLLLK